MTPADCIDIHSEAAEISDIAHGDSSTTLDVEPADQPTSPTSEEYCKSISLLLPTRKALKDLSRGGEVLLVLMEFSAVLLEVLEASLFMWFAVHTAPTCNHWNVARSLFFQSLCMYFKALWAVVLVVPAHQMLKAQVHCGLLVHHRAAGETEMAKIEQRSYTKREWQSMVGGLVALSMIIIGEIGQWLAWLLGMYASFGANLDCSAPVWFQVFAMMPPPIFIFVPMVGFLIVLFRQTRIFVHEKILMQIGDNLPKKTEDAVNFAV